mmetsp:Transcript_9306/g.20379  ORF Transcript_9306/g.20379 Transcript_9306/m.20379 type:complete len:455 (-) Transcript_9306:230-1594(-)
MGAAHAQRTNRHSVAAGSTAMLSWLCHLLVLTSCCSKKQHHSSTLCFTSSCTTTAAAAHIPQIVHVYYHKTGYEFCRQFFSTLARSLSVSVGTVHSGSSVFATPTGHAFANFLNALTIAPIVAAHVDFSLIMEATPAMYLATPPSEATAPPVGSTTPVRLLHFVRDVRRLAVSGFLYHSQDNVPKTERWLQETDPCSELSAFAATPNESAGRISISQLSINLLTKASVKTDDMGSKLRRWVAFLQLPHAEARFAEMLDQCVTLRKLALKLASESQKEQRNVNYMYGLRALRRVNDSAALQLDTLRAVPQILWMAVNAKGLHALENDLFRVRQVTLDNFSASASGIDMGSASSDDLVRNWYQSKMRELLSFLLGDEHHITPGSLEQIAQNITKVSFVPPSHAIAKATYLAKTKSSHFTNAMVSDSKRRSWYMQLADGSSALSAVLLHANVALGFQ